MDASPDPEPEPEPSLPTEPPKKKPTVATCSEIERQMSDDTERIQRLAKFRQEHAGLLMAAPGPLATVDHDTKQAFLATTCVRMNARALCLCAGCAAAACARFVREDAHTNGLTVAPPSASAVPGHAMHVLCGDVECWLRAPRVANWEHERTTGEIAIAEGSALLTVPAGVLQRVDRPFATATTPLATAAVVPRPRCAPALPRHSSLDDVRVARRTAPREWFVRVGPLADAHGICDSVSLEARCRSGTDRVHLR